MFIRASVEVCLGTKPLARVTIFFFTFFTHDLLIISGFGSHIAVLVFCRIVPATCENRTRKKVRHLK